MNHLLILKVSDVLLEIYVVGIVVWGRFLLILYYICRILLQKFVLKIICLFTNKVLSLTLLSFLDAFLTNSFNYFLRYDFTLLLLYILFWPEWAAWTSGATEVSESPRVTRETAVTLHKTSLASDHFVFFFVARFLSCWRLWYLVDQADQAAC